ncbi:MAG: Altered inheritance of mitochondria protein 24, mitochondrial [Peltula sp. TS41687]|nr:MAG: Altered inheritance of mitochondria protein 24, mitochondrial [Peltula sp. TS41687]
MSLAYWGNSEISGRGLLAVVGQGQIYQVTLKPGEEFVVHPSNVTAYTMTGNKPQPYRLKHSSLRLQIPKMNLISETKFIKTMRESDAWKVLRKVYSTVQTWTRRTIWGDRLFLRFEGPTTILLQSRASRLRDVLTDRDVNEIAQVVPGRVQVGEDSTNPEATDTPSSESQASTSGASPAGHLRIASVKPGGKVSFEDTDNFEHLTGRKGASST